MQNSKAVNQLEIIKRRYSNEKYNVVHEVPREVLLRTLTRTLALEEIKDKTVLEIGAGCSHFLKLFLESGCKKLIANDLMEERLKLNDIDDKRYIEIPGDFLEIEFAEKVDIIFSNLTMMFVIPMMDDFFEKMHQVLQPNGIIINSDTNYLCPMSIYRLFSDKSGANPSKVFNPFSFAKKARKHGFIVEKLVPFTSKYEWTVGHWLLGTNFSMVARKA